MSPRVLAVGQGLAVIVLSQLMGVLAKLALFEVEAFTFVWLQLGAALAYLLAYTFLWRRERWPSGLDRRTWLAILFVGAVNFGLCRVWTMMGIERRRELRPRLDGPVGDPHPWRVAGAAADRRDRDSDGGRAARAVEAGGDAFLLLFIGGKMKSA